MPSPFPGMDPYLERPGMFHDFHRSFVPALRGLLTQEVAPKYFVRIALELYVHAVEADSEKHGFLEVVEFDQMRVVTTSEVLDVSNKRSGELREKYLRKRERLLDSDVHFVEIDLLRAFRPMPMQPTRQCDYRVFVSRAEERPNAKIWRFSLHDALPTIGVPLRTGDPDAPLDLGVALQHVFAEARYADYIYKKHPEPPLSPEDALWAKQLIEKASAPTSA